MGAKKLSLRNCSLECLGCPQCLGKLHLKRCSCTE